MVFDFTGPFERTYIQNYPKGRYARDREVFATFDEAKTAALLYPRDKCSGITQTKLGFELRKGPNFSSTDPLLRVSQDDKIHLGMRSWIRC